MSFDYQPLLPGSAQQLANAAPSKPLKVWSGSAWVAGTLKVWSGTAWVTGTLKVYNGTSWVTL